MRCPSCQNHHAPNQSICDWCGAPLTGAQKSGTVIEPQRGAPPAQRAPVVGPGEKRKTMYEPGPAAGVQPAVDDFFDQPPPARSVPRDPNDPFAESIRPQPAQPVAPPAAAAPPAAPPAHRAAPAGRPRSSSNRTIIENPSQTQRMLRGALFIFQGQNREHGEIRPLYDGRNSIGRAADRDIVVNDGRVSGEHGFLFVRADRMTYVDTSSNGSRVDGRVVFGEQVEVKSGSVIEAGDVRLVMVTIPLEAMSS